MKKKIDYEKLNLSQTELLEPPGIFIPLAFYLLLNLLENVFIRSQQHKG